MNIKTNFIPERLVGRISNWFQLQIEKINYLSRCDCAKWSKFLAQFVIINGVIQIFHKQIDTGVPVEALHFERFELFL